MAQEIGAEVTGYAWVLAESVMGPGSESGPCCFELSAPSCCAHLVLRFRAVIPAEYFLKF